MPVDVQAHAREGDSRHRGTAQVKQRPCSLRNGGVSRRAVLRAPAAAASPPGRRQPAGVLTATYTEVGPGAAAPTSSFRSLSREILIELNIAGRRSSPEVVPRHPISSQFPRRRIRPGGHSACPEGCLACPDDVPDGPERPPLDALRVVCVPRVCAELGDELLDGLFASGDRVRACARRIARLAAAHVLRVRRQRGRCTQPAARSCVSGTRPALELRQLWGQRRPGCVPGRRRAARQAVCR